MSGLASQAARAKSPRRRAPRAGKAGAALGELIVGALSTSQKRDGVSLSALKTLLRNHGYNVEKNKTRINLAVKRLVGNGALVRAKGTGATSSFMVSKKPKTKKKSAKRAKKTKAAVKKPKAAQRSGKKARNPNAKKPKGKKPNVKKPNGKKPNVKKPKMKGTERRKTEKRTPKPARKTGAKKAPAK